MNAPEQLIKSSIRSFASEIVAQTKRTDQAIRSHLYLRKTDSSAAAIAATSDTQSSPEKELTKFRDDIQAVERCCRGKCYWRCHKSYKIEGRFWSTEISQLSRMLISSDRPYCKIDSEIWTILLARSFKRRRSRSFDRRARVWSNPERLFYRPLPLIMCVYLP